MGERVFGEDFAHPTRPVNLIMSCQSLQREREIQGGILEGPSYICSLLYPEMWKKRRTIENRGNEISVQMSLAYALECVRNSTIELPSN